MGEMTPSPRDEGGSRADDDPGAVPAPVSRLVEAINGADVDGFVAVFAPDGLIDDGGRRCRGSEGIRGWALSDVIGAGARMEILSARTAGAVTTTRFSWRSAVFTGDSVGKFTIVDGAVARFVIRGEA